MLLVLFFGEIFSYGHCVFLETLRCIRFSQFITKCLTAFREMCILIVLKENTQPKEHIMSYTELQAALKDLRDNHGVELQTKLAGKGITKEVLQAEYDRVTAKNVETPSKEVETVLEPIKPVVAHSFKAMVTVQRQRKAKGFTVKSRKVSPKVLTQLFEDLQALSQLTLTSHR
jgi:hypothetical protein